MRLSVKWSVFEVGQQEAVQLVVRDKVLATVSIILPKEAHVVEVAGVCRGKAVVLQEAGRPVPLFVEDAQAGWRVPGGAWGWQLHWGGLLHLGGQQTE